MSMKKVIEIALGELGEHEDPPGSNRVKYWESYDKSFQGQPWCVSFLWWVFQQAGERMAFFGGGRTASCSMLLRWYWEQGLTVDAAEVQPGDIVLLNFNKGKSPEHCGLVTKVNNPVKLDNGVPYSVWTIEGNTSPSDGSQSNGGMVCEKMRYTTSQVVAVCRPQYKPEETYPRDDVTGHWAESAIRRVIKRNLMVGYTDGSFQPDKPVTRAEIAVILDRMEDDMK